MNEIDCKIEKLMSVDMGAAIRRLKEACHHLQNDQWKLFVSAIDNQMIIH